jgi:hypothetical protein
LQRNSCNLISLLLNIICSIMSIYWVCHGPLSSRCQRWASSALLHACAVHLAPHVT